MVAAVTGTISRHGLMKPISVSDFRELAQRRLPRFLFEYIDGGAYGEVTLRRNVADLEAIALRQRVARDVSQIDLTCDLFGTPSRLPLVLAPVGLAGMNWRRGEVEAAQAAADAGIPFALSTVSVCSIQEVRRIGNQPFWFQLYMIRDRGFMRELLAQAREADCPALLFTLDMPVPGTRYRDYRSGLVGAPGMGGQFRRLVQGALHPRWAWDVGICGRPHHLGNIAPVLGGNTGLEDFFAWMRNNFDPTTSWRDIEFVRSEWSRPLILKGILDPDDAREAVRCGADGLVVSNHGGRQLDGVPSTARALPSIAEAVGDELTVLADGGVRTGLDVMRMLALGAKALMIGRPWAYALAAQGRAGVAALIDNFEAEMRVAAALTGVRSVAEVTRDILVNRPDETASRDQ